MPVADNRIDTIYPTRTALGGAVGRAGRHASRFIDTSLFNERSRVEYGIDRNKRAKKSRHIRSKLRIKLRNVRIEIDETGPSSRIGAHT